MDDKTNIRKKSDNSIRFSAFMDHEIVHRALCTGEISTISNRDDPRRPFHLCGCTFDESRLRIRGTCESVPFTDANGVKGEGIDEHRRLLQAGNKLSLPESRLALLLRRPLSAIVAPPVEINDEETRTNTRRRNEPSLPGAALTRERRQCGGLVTSTRVRQTTYYILIGVVR